MKVELTYNELFQLTPTLSRWNGLEIFNGRMGLALSSITEELVSVEKQKIKDQNSLIAEHGNKDKKITPDNEKGAKALMEFGETKFTVDVALIKREDIIDIESGIPATEIMAMKKLISKADEKI